MKNAVIIFLSLLFSGCVSTHGYLHAQHNSDPFDNRDWRDNMNMIGAKVEAALDEGERVVIEAGLYHVADDDGYLNKPDTLGEVGVKVRLW